ncbi:MerR family transcriptional regulator [Amycolatopsis suaedae]|uniref:MerR family transcriptional regulator n=1 Tax=Amycolatopsis suaedae TaxID=2510978 RepID=A0A4Q7IZM6_9PSEU|nr:MerR family transcriptional regulator [Amycolatopsis suaedae]RZQ59553.1 MerR family transcriptional regulator [Amycolatopsis suaedae]
MSDELITIGVLARASGLTPSALRFYADCGLLPPASVDTATGYRYYSASQRERAIAIRRLRELDVPLPDVTRILDADPARAAQLLDRHVDALRERADRAAELAEVVKRSLLPPGLVLAGPVLAAAVEQVTPAAGAEGVLAGVLLEADAGAAVLTATDRYRLSTRALTPVQAGGEFAAVLDAAALARTVPWLREQDRVTLAPAAGALSLTAMSGESRDCGVVDGDFPDYRAVLDALTPASTRVLVGREALLDVVRHGGETVVLTADATGLRARLTGEPSRRIAATVDGRRVRVAFQPHILRAAVGTSIGPDVMLDITGPDQPVVVRSATDGDLTTLAMPTLDPTRTVAG